MYRFLIIGELVIDRATRRRYIVSGGHLIEVCPIDARFIVGPRSRRVQAVKV